MVWNIFLFLICISLNGEFPINENLCEQFKTFKLGDSAANYDKFVKELDDNNLNVCACIKELTNKRKQKALKGVYSEQEIQEIEAKIAESANTTPELIINFKEIFDDDIKQRVWKKAQELEIKGIINVHLGNRNHFAVNKPSFLEYLSGKPQSFQNKNLELSGYFFRDCTVKNTPKIISIQNDDLSHEFMHIKMHHPEEASLMNASKTSMIYKIVGGSILLWNFSQLPTSFQIIVSWLPVFYSYFSPAEFTKESLKLIRAQEAEADRVSAACGTYQNALDHYVWAKLHYEAFMKLYSENPAFAEDKTHPPAYKRYYWATVIKNAREAEERFKKKQEEESKATSFTLLKDRLNAIFFGLK